MRELLVQPTYKKTPQESQNKQKRHNYYQNKSLSKILASNKTPISFEICPNKDFDRDLLSDMSPDFCSVTWLGSLITKFKSDYGRIPAILLAKELRCHGNEVVLHLAGRNLNESDALRILEVVKLAGIRSLLLLQGDRSLAVHCNDNADFLYARDLVAFVRHHYGDYFSIGVAGYPEKHPQSPTKGSDVRYLRDKVSSGADFILTQASFDYNAFKEFSKICNQHHIDVPIVAGVFIISSYSTFKSMVKFCEINVPEHVSNVLERYRDNEEIVRNYGIHLATSLMKELLNDSDFSGVHVFTLNNLEVVKPVLKALGVYGTEIERPISF